MKKEYPFCNTREASDYQPPIAKKAFQALSLLQDWITLSELEKCLGLSKSSVQRYLNMFVSFGFKVKWSSSRLNRSQNVYKITNTTRTLKKLREQSLKA